jgi:uncharacterized phage protein (TIGR01671 family)
MNREIKFRAWDENLKEMINPYLHLSQDGHFHAHDMTNSGNVIKPENVMQFTGLTDKNGVKIYEFDVVNVIHPCWQNKCLVEFMNGSFVFHSKENITQDVIIPGYTFMRNKWSVEVIGNIYEHKHLLQ